MPDPGERSEPVSSAALDAIFAALAHPARRQILVSLYARGSVMSAGEIADRFKCSWPTTTRHLAVLKEANLLASGRQGRYHLYALRSAVAVRAAEWVLSWAAPAADRPASTNRPDWTGLPYAAMRNAMPPEDDPSNPSDE